MWSGAGMRIGQDPRVIQALDAWAEIAPTLGLDPAGFRSKLIWDKADATRSHVVVRLIGPQRLILKMVERGPAEETPAQTAVAIRAAHAALQSNPRAHVPDVLFANDNVMVMTEAAGKTLEAQLRSGRAHGPLLRRAGAWLAAYHGAGEVEPRTYRPHFMLDHIAQKADAVRAGMRKVAELDLFLACCDALPDRALAGQMTLSAPKHGDFNTRNLLLGPEGETALDFKPPSSAPVGFDIVRMLMDYAELHQPAGADLLLQATQDAFFKGYTLVGPDDPAVRFLPHVQLLNDWMAIPHQETQRSWRQAARLAGIVTLASQSLGRP